MAGESKDKLVGIFAVTLACVAIWFAWGRMFTSASQDSYVSPFHAGDTGRLVRPDFDAGQQAIVLCSERDLTSVVDMMTQGGDRSGCQHFADAKIVFEVAVGTPIEIVEVAGRYVEVVVRGGRREGEIGWVNDEHIEAGGVTGGSGREPSSPSVAPAGSSQGRDNADDIEHDPNDLASIASGGISVRHVEIGDGPSLGPALGRKVVTTKVLEALRSVAGPTGDDEPEDAGASDDEESGQDGELEEHETVGGDEGDSEADVDVADEEGRLWAGVFRSERRRHRRIDARWTFIYGPRIRVEYAIDRLKNGTPKSWTSTGDLREVTKGSVLEGLHRGRSRSVEKDLVGARWRIAYRRHGLDFLEFRMSSDEKHAADSFRDRFNQLCIKANLKTSDRVSRITAAADPSTRLPKGLSVPPQSLDPDPPRIDLESIWHPWLVVWKHVHLTRGVTEHGAAFFAERAVAEQFVTALGAPVASRVPRLVVLNDPYLSPEWALAYHLESIPAWDRAGKRSESYLGFRVGDVQVRIALEGNDSKEVEDWYFDVIAALEESGVLEYGETPVAPELDAAEE